MTAVGERLTPSACRCHEEHGKEHCHEPKHSSPVPRAFRHLTPSPSQQGKAFHARPSSSPPLLPFERACRRTRPRLTGDNAKIWHPVTPPPPFHSDPRYSSAAGRGVVPGTGERDAGRTDARRVEPRYGCGHFRGWVRGVCERNFGGITAASREVGTRTSHIARRHVAQGGRDAVPASTA